jgi:hypothetical protein
MGGFVYHGDNEPLRTLSLKDIEELVEKDEIEYPIITREEIKDKSKGDAVTKGLVLIQTMWFLLQCVARGAQHLSITELELATAGFALLNVITYALWWDKPLNVQCAVRVQKKHVCLQRNGGQVASGEEETGRGDSQQRGEATAEGVRERTTFTTRVQDWWRNFWHWWSWSNAWEEAETIFEMIFGPFSSMIWKDEDDDTFFVGKNEDDNQQSKAFLGALVVSMVFGGIHCIGWAESFSFPSHMEQLLWKMSSSTIVGIPLYFLVLVLIGQKYDDLPSIFQASFAILYLLRPILYTLARIALLVLALIALRSLPPSALQTVHWTTFIPHV